MKNPMNFYPNGTGKIARGLLLLVIALGLPRAFAVNVLTQHNDLSRTGANTSETILTPANVAQSFGTLFTDPVDGQVYAQPLYVQNLGIAGGMHDVVFVCTESNSVYAFDADTPGITYWHVKLGMPFPAPCSDLTPIVGITGTPVINLSNDTMYLDTKLQAGPTHKLHALDITTGNEKFGGPVTVTTTGFSASLEHQRPGVLLLGNVVYLCFGSHCDQGDYHGYILGYNATNLTQLYSFNTTPDGSEGAIWSGGMAPAVDANGYIYVMTGNGDFDGTNNFSMSMIKLNSHLTVEDYATPTNWSSLSDDDQDFGSGGPVILPPHYVVGIGKDAVLNLANTVNMGHVGGFVQSFTAGPSTGDTVGKAPVYWQGPTMQYLFISHANDPTVSFQFTGSNIDTTPLGTSAYVPADRVGGISLSANGTTNGILWEIDDDSNLRAYDAVKFPTVLWTGSIGSYVKMNCPTIANGKVYVGTSSTLTVLGLTKLLYTQVGDTNLVLNWASGTLLQSTNLLGPWVTNKTSSPYTVTPTNSHMFYRLALP
jgi:hypothetical protein